MSHATVKDIAKLAGVSTATVSRVINASSMVSANPRTAVISSIDQLQYTPNRNASELALIAAVNRRRGSIRVVLPAKSDRRKKSQRGLSLLCGQDLSARETASIDKQIEGLREAFRRIEAQLRQIEYTLAKPGNLTARR